jgi:hypothetical protein
MTDERDEVLQEIGAALDVEPSPAFAVRVREALELERPAPGATWAWVRVWIGGLSGAVFIATVLWSRSSRPVVPIAGEGQSVLANATARVGSTERVMVDSGDSRPVASSLTTPAFAARAIRVAAAGQVVHGGIVEPDAMVPSLEVLIPVSEIAAFRQFLIAATDGRVRTAPSDVATDPETGALLPIPEIVIPPIASTLPINVEPGSGGRNR